MFNIKYPDFIAMTFFFLIIGSLYIFPNIFIFYLITLNLFIYIIYALANHKILFSYLKMKFKNTKAYITLFEKKAINSHNYNFILEETAFDLIQFPKNKYLFIEKQIYNKKLFYEVDLLSYINAFFVYIEKHQLAEKAVVKQISNQ